MIISVVQGDDDPMTISELLTPAETAKKLHTTYGTLAVARCHRRWPLRFVRVGRKIFYKAEDVQAFIEAQTDAGDGPRPARKRKGGAR
jgi:hypothetical protein